MASIKKLSKKQIRDLKNQVKDSREKIIQESDMSLEEKDEHVQKNAAKKDKLGFTREDRSSISDKMKSLTKQSPKMTWNYEPGLLVRLPDGDIGLIVKNEATDLELRYNEYDMKKVMRHNRYAGQVYVVTSKGNNWYYPSQLKIVRD